MTTAADFEAAKKRQEDDGLVEFRLGNQSFSFDLRVVAQALWRVNEVAHCNPSTAQILGDAYGEAQAEIAKIRNRAASAAAAAEAEAKRLANQLLLDYVPSELERRQISSSADTRKALISTHPDVIEAEEYARHLEWVVRDLEIKEKRVYSALTIVRAVMGERFPYYRGGSSHGAPTNKDGRYGAARY